MCTVKFSSSEIRSWPCKCVTNKLMYICIKYMYITLSLFRPVFIDKMYGVIKGMAASTESIERTSQAEKSVLDPLKGAL